MRKEQDREYIGGSLEKMVIKLEEVETNISINVISVIKQFIKKVLISEKNKPYKVLQSCTQIIRPLARFILTIMIYVKQIIFSNDCISKRLKDRTLKLFS